MQKPLSRWLNCTVALALLCIGDARAIDAPGVPQQYYVVDENHIDLMSAFSVFTVPDVSIGSRERPLAHIVQSQPSEFGPERLYEDNFTGTMRPIWDYSQTCPAGTVVGVSVAVAGTTDFFCLVGGVFQSNRGWGATLVATGVGTYAFTDRNGVVSTLSESAHGATQAQYWARVVRTRYPNGLQLDYAYRLIDSANARIISINRNDGLQLHYDYNNVNGVGFFRTVSRVVALNNGFEYCDPGADSCAFAQSWRMATYAHTQQNIANPNQGGPFYTLGAYTVTDQSGQATVFRLDGWGQVVGFRPPSSPATDLITYEYCARIPPYNCFVWSAAGIGAGSHRLYITQFEGKVVATQREGQPWSYYYQAFTTNAPYIANWSYRSTSPLATNRTVVAQATSDSGSSALISVTTETGHQATYCCTIVNRMIQDTSPEGDRREYTYDARGNVTQMTYVPKPGSQLANRLVRAGYDAVCANPVTCNQPNWVEDANGNRTDFTYDVVHGGVLTETGPAVNGVRPQIRRSYVQRHAWYLNGAGAQVQAATPIWVLDRESYCRTSAASGNGCTVAGDEVVTTFEYGPNSGPNNLLLRGRVVTADGVSLRTCWSYDRFGNRLSETTPRANLASCP